MGAGEMAAGEELAGDDSAIVATKPRNVKLPAAVYYDGRTKDFPLDDEGHYLESHPVDQKVSLALLVLVGTVSGSPTLGSTLRKKRLINSLTIRNEITDIVNRALAAMIKAGDIRLLSVDVELPADSTVLVRVQYENLRLSANSGVDRVRTQGVTINAA